MCERVRKGVVFVRVAINDGPVTQDQIVLIFVVDYDGHGVRWTDHLWPALIRGETGNATQ